MLYNNFVLFCYGGASMADFIVGSVVRDDDFWFRKNFVDTVGISQ